MPGSLPGESTFTAFVEQAEPRLRRALVGRFGSDAGRDALAEALGYAWEHWPRVEAMANPAGYIYRVAVSRTRASHQVPWPATPVSFELPDVDPRLPQVLRRISERQRTAVYLVHGCQWSHSEAAEAMGISTSSVRNHLRRGLARLRVLLEEPTDARHH